MLESVMYTTNRDASEAELNRRIPLSIAPGTGTVNFCAAPDSQGKQYQAEHPKFGMFRSIKTIKTEEACKAEGGTFHPYVFKRMLRVFPMKRTSRKYFP
jgi:hypothetical protein